MPKTEDFTDNFRTASAVKWGNYGTNPTVVAGRLSIVPTSSYPSIYSAVPYDLTSSFVMVNLVQAPNVGNGTSSATMNVQVSAGNSLQILVEGGNLVCRETKAGVNSDTSLTYDPVAHAWLRIREQAGIAYWDTSADALTWTNRRSKTITIASPTNATINFLAGYYGTEPSPGTALFDSFNIVVPPVALSSFALGRSSLGGPDGGTVVSRNYFAAADWLWNPIPASPVLDTNSAAMVTSLASTAGGAIRSAGLYEYGVRLVGPNGITSSTPRYTVNLTNYPAWGQNPLGTDTVPIPNGTGVPPGTDMHLSIADPTTGKVYSFWQAKNTAGVWSASWAGVTTLQGDGLEAAPGSSTATRLSRYAAVIRGNEIAAGQIPHALFFATDMAHTTAFRYPATKSDGDNAAGVATPIPEGARIQLDPTIDVESIPNITPAEVAVAKALQVYGAYCGDKGGARMGFIFEYLDDGSTPGQVYVDAGLGYDYFNMLHIPWSSLRVLKTWNGT